MENVHPLVIGVVFLFAWLVLRNNGDQEHEPARFNEELRLNLRDRIRIFFRNLFGRV